MHFGGDVKQKKNYWLLLRMVLGIIFLVTIFDLESNALIMPKEKMKSARSPGLFKPMVDPPEAQVRVHRVGNVYLAITNWGFFGSQGRQIYESIGGCFNPSPGKEAVAPSFEMPPNSGLEYLYWSALWVGAIVEGETLVTVGADGWFGINEMAPAQGSEGAIIERSTRPGVECYSPDAISEQDIIAVYYDTADAPLTYQDPRTDWDERKHRPLGIEVTQKSYSWSYAYAEDFILIDFNIKNINEKRSIEKMWLGLFVDADVYGIDENVVGSEQGAQDDIAGFKDSVFARGKKIEIATSWVADNDGQPSKGLFTETSPTGVSGVRVVRAPKEVKTNFNWWISHSEGYPKDWGPWLKDNQEKWEQINPYGTGKRFPGNAMGTPGGDRSKYFVMSNGEWDYDQIFTGVYSDITAAPSPEDPVVEWVKASQMVKDDLADGFDTRYLFSFGEFPYLAPGDSVMVTIAYVGGEEFHRDPSNRARSLPRNPKAFYGNLDFSDFAVNSVWAAWVYDNPIAGEDTGDGIPDFKGPPPPVTPELTVDTEDGQIKIKWNGKRTEKSRDSFTFANDFEGYNIYINRTGFNSDWTLVASFDRPDNYSITQWHRYEYRPRKWNLVESSITLDSLQSAFKIPPIGDDPLAWNKDHPYVYLGTDTLVFSIPQMDSLGEWARDTLTGLCLLDTLYFVSYLDSLYFERQGWNKGLRDIKVYKEYADSVDQRLIPQTDTIQDRYWDYEFTMSGFLPSESFYISVTTFDFGHAPTAIPPLESGKSINKTLVYPVDSPELTRKQGDEIVVYPNPYRGDQRVEYRTYGSEPGATEFDRRIHFLNLPAKCTIRIFTLDGDLVRTIYHDKTESDPTASHEEWDMITRNTQAVVSGIYLFSVESEYGNHVGKFVILK
jgi:hypothetical protein